MHTYKASLLGIFVAPRCTSYPFSFAAVYGPSSSLMHQSFIFLYPFATYQFWYNTLQSTPNAVNKHSPQTSFPTFHGRRFQRYAIQGKTVKEVRKIIRI